MGRVSTFVLVAAAALGLSSCAPTQRPAVAEPVKVDAVRGAISGVKQKVTRFVSLTPKCEATGEIYAKVVGAPVHGAVSFEKGLDFPNFPKDNARSVCNTSKVPALIMYYLSEPGFVGQERVAVETTDSEGTFRHFEFVIKVQ